MRAIPPALQEKLDGGVTTLCRCWLIKRTDGIVQGFTEHDQDILLGNIKCLAGSGLSGSEVTQKLGLAVDSSEVTGAVADDTLNEADLAAGRYDGAIVEVWITDWAEPELRMLLAKGTLGEVRREGTAFVAEIRGLSDSLGQQTGRLYTATCSADLGDPRCKIDLINPLYRGEGTVSRLGSTSTFTVSGLESFEDGWFTRGKLTFTAGANIGLSAEIKKHRQAATVSLSLWQPMPEPIALGDAFVVTAGCDKRFQTCHDRFNNVVNFRGFPHIPGNDFVVSYPLPGEPGNDGSSRQG